MNIYQAILNELFSIVVLFPKFQIGSWIREQDVDVTNINGLYMYLKKYREQLELDNHVITDDEETRKIMDEGVRIHSLLIKEMMYGKEE